MFGKAFLLGGDSRTTFNPKSATPFKSSFT